MPAKLKLKTVDLKHDPENICGRAYDILSMSLYDLAGDPAAGRKERVYVTNQILLCCLKLNLLNSKGDANVPIEFGSTVREYEKLFANKDAAGGRSLRARSRAPAAFAAALDLDDSDDGGGESEDGDGE